MPVRNRIAEMAGEIAAWRRDFHAHPELRFEERRTAARVAALLRDFGCDSVTEGVGRTGVVATIEGRRTRSGRTIGFRADMDALPIEEATGAAHASRTPGVMHACGHDGHSAMLLGAAKYLAETRNFDGRVVLVFQPAEEGSGGARAMLDDGLLERWGIDEIYGLHNWPGLPVGAFVVKPGRLLAATDKFAITVTGRGGHAAMPHLGVDTTLAAAQIVVALQSIVARNVSPLESAVVSVCSFRTDTDAFNVIPDSAVLRGTVRSFDAALRDRLRTRIAQLAEATAAGFGATAVLDYEAGAPALVNPAAEAEQAAAVAETVAGAGQVHRDFTPTMGGEDFAEFLARRPGAFLFVGNGESAALHNPAYEFDDAAIPHGASWFAAMAEARLPTD